MAEISLNNYILSKYKHMLNVLCIFDLSIDPFYLFMMFKYHYVRRYNTFYTYEIKVEPHLNT